VVCIHTLVIRLSSSDRSIRLPTVSKRTAPRIRTEPYHLCGTALLLGWPGAAVAGAVDGTEVISADIYPTILEIAGVVDSNETTDGLSLVSTLRGESPLVRDALYWHYPHYHPGGASPSGAVRVGRYKLIEYFEDMRVELYDLDEDIGEFINLANTLPEQTVRLLERLHAWQSEVGAQMPTENPDYDPARALNFTR